jgi:DNA replication regulator DPB11
VDPDAELVNLSFSGLDESEACWVRRLIRALGLRPSSLQFPWHQTECMYLGINLAPNFSRRSTHLLCPSRTGAKFDKAREWGVPVVDMGWLSEVANTGVIPDGNGQRDRDRDMIDANVLPVQGPKSAKAKGKEREEDYWMADITNGMSFLVQNLVLGWLRFKC